MKFWILEYAEQTERFTTHYSPCSPKNTTPAPTCKTCGQAIGARIWIPPYRVRIQLYWDEFGDFAFCGVTNILVSERFLTTYANCGLKGFVGFEKVDVLGFVAHKRKYLSQLPNYYYVRSIDSNTLIDETASHVVRVEPLRCSQCRIGGVKTIDKIVVEESSWTGDDVFFARGLPGTNIVTERFFECYTKNKITGARLIPAESYSW